MATTKPGSRKANKAEPKSSGRLATYEAKRDFEVTPEPRGSSQAKPGGEKKTALAFVVQKHDARRMHYDVRLEVDGAMASWAVPKGPSYDPTVRRLAVQTEDHPMDYNAFEGRIPEGEYGAGDVLIWDRGTYETVPPGQERAMMEKGHMHVRLFGEKLVGEWHIIRTDRRGGDDGAGGNGKGQWLFFKAKDARANPAYDVVTERPESVVSGRQATRGPRRVGASEQGTSAKALHETVGDPMLATAVTSISDPAKWLFEVKYDGYRLLACKAGSDVRLFTRRGNDWTDRFRPIAEGMARLRARECVVDGEACAVDDDGRPSFHALQEWLGGNSSHARIGFAAFDLLWLDGRDVRGEPIEARRELLEKLLEGQGAAALVLALGRGRRDAAPRGGEGSRARGVDGQAEGHAVHRRPIDLLAEASPLPPAGVRGHRLDPSLGKQAGDGRARPRRRRGRAARPRRAGRHGLQRSRSQRLGEEALGGSRRRAPRRSRAEDEGRALGRAEGRRRVCFHRVDERWLDAPAALPRDARGQDADGVREGGWRRRA